MRYKLESPYLSAGFEWLRGNLHTHTTVSDGALTPEKTVELYESMGYDYLAISDHDKLTPVDPLVPNTKLILVPASEVSANGPHVLAVNVSSTVAPAADRQQVIDDTNKLGGFAVLNHPSWLHGYNHFPQEEMMRLTGYAGIEIYNGVIDWLEGSALATDRWDQLLTAGIKVWGYAHDDTHLPINAGRAWNVVQAMERTTSSVASALSNGRFYASTGVSFESIGVADGAIVVSASNADVIRFISRWSAMLYEAKGNTASFTPNGAEGYVRVECYGPGASMAWSQPFYITVD